MTTTGLLFVVLIVGTMGFLVLRGSERQPPKYEISATGSQQDLGPSDQR
ncbi:hypothetical protein [Streptomyces diastaticus]